MSRAAVARVLTGLALAGAAVTACTTGTATVAKTPPLTTGVDATPVSVLPSTPNATPTTTAATSAASAASSAPAKSAARKPVSGPARLPADYCTAAQLSLRILPGGAERNYEIAAVTFTNNSSRSCSISGYPAVQLRRNGQVLSTASPDTAQPMRLVHLAPGAQAQAQIRDHSTCQAPLSDTIQATAPAPLTALHLESTGLLLQMRGCTVTVDPIGLSS